MDIRSMYVRNGAVLLTQTPVEKTQEILVATIAMRRVKSTEMHIDNDNDRE
jgi:hypothetical protein